MTTNFLTPLQVEAIDSTTWVLLSDLVWQGDPAAGGDTFIVGAGEETDFATVPWWTQSLLPRTGTWTLAAVLHDLMCRLLWQYHQARRSAVANKLDPDVIEPPVFSSVDADAVFRKNAREGGTGPIRSELLWLGVRYGALANPARRKDWFRKTGFRVLVDTVLVLLALFIVVATLSWVWPW